MRTKAHWQKHSLFFKLLLIYGISFLLIALIVLWIFRGREERVKSYFQKSFYNYANYIVDDIGSPPNLQRAKVLGKEYGISIFIEGPNLQWSNFRNTKKIIKKFKKAKKEKHYKKPINIIELTRGDYYYRIRPRVWRNVESEFLISGIFLIILVLSISYYFVKKVFYPIKHLEIAVKNFADNDLSSRVKDIPNNEFGDLASGFNSMADRIEKNIKSLRELLIAVSHEFRSPLARMRMAVEFIDNDKVSKSLKDEIKALDQLTGNLLEREKLLNNPNYLMKEEIKFNDYLNDIFAPYMNIKSQIEFNLRENIVIKIDKEKMQIVLRNIMENAIRYGEDKKIVVSTELSSEKNNFLIKIMDQGIGMSEEQIKQLGTAFYRTDSSRSMSTGGNGLGIFLSDAIVKAHKGNLKFKSNIGKGTTAIIEIPINAQ